MRVATVAAMLSLTAGLGSCGGAEPSPASPPPAAASPAAAPTIAETAKAEPPRGAHPVPVGQGAGANAKPVAPPPGASTERLMRAHFTDALLIRKAVIAGTPERAAEPAEALAKAENLEDVPASWRASL